MDLLIKIWLKLGYVIYYIAWFGSMAMFKLSYMTGILIGLITFIVYLVILQILSFLNKDGWLWRW